MKAHGLCYLKDVPLGEKVKGFYGVSGINRGQGYIQINLETSSEDDDPEDNEVNEWTDSIWRNSLANTSIVKMREVSKSRFFGPGRVFSLGG
jgi:hypothetical protein